LVVRCFVGLFEVVVEDLLGRIGRLRTRSGKVVETPAFLPVINPIRQDIPASWIAENLRAEIVITNAYILYKRLRNEVLEKTVHGILEFNGVVMTDSGGYQILEYGEVDVGPEDIAVFEEAIKTDIAVPLDIPTGLSSREQAVESVEKTLRNLETTIRILAERSEKHALWVGTVQGGVHLDLVRFCAEKVREMGFDMYALGSPTPLMESYRFSKLFEVLFTAKSTLGYDKPLHLFGAGHPMMFAFAVALGVDTFDSASYYLYAEDDRYMTGTGTIRLDRLDYLVCECPICSNITIEELKKLPRKERVELIAKHNLYVCFREVAEIKQAIKDGRLVELLEIKARSHPSLYQAFREVVLRKDIVEVMEHHTPLYSRRGINIYDDLSLKRPEVRRARRKLLENFFKNREVEYALLLPINLNISKRRLEELLSKHGVKEVDILLYGGPYGLLPLELRYTYPFAQTEFPKHLSCEEDVVETVVQQIRESRYRNILLLEGRGVYIREAAKKIEEKLREVGVKVEVLYIDRES